MSRSATNSTTFGTTASTGRANTITNVVRCPPRAGPFPATAIVAPNLYGDTSTTNTTRGGATALVSSKLTHRATSNTVHVDESQIPNASRLKPSGSNFFRNRLIDASGV
jgi:hypothetical protein